MIKYELIVGCKLQKIFQKNKRLEYDLQNINHPY